MKVTSKQEAWNKVNEISLITLCVDGDHYIANDTMRKVYDGLKRSESWLASDLIASYCEANGIRWGTIQGISIDHYAHGKYLFLGALLLRDYLHDGRRERLMSKTITAVGIEKIGRRFAGSIDHAAYTLNGEPKTVEPFRTCVHQSCRGLAFLSNGIRLFQACSE